MTQPTQSQGDKLRDMIATEYKKCAVNPVYFLRKYGIIQHPERGKIQFDLYDYQEKVITNFQLHNLNIILKGRQIGMTTAIAGYSLWLMLFHNDKSVLVIATKQETAKTLVKKVKIMHTFLPSWLRGKIISDNKLSLQFKNGSEIKAVASSEDAGRTESLSLLIIDECLAGNHTTYIRNKITGEVKQINLEDLYNVTEKKEGV